uniref:pyruvate decarboxylase n=1 Tax=Diospyros kaki TaxID=35925 RepID=L0CKB3_DIOKA|nr:pyruvate decarboxylase 5 [Diospyros kaki]
MDTKIGAVEVSPGPSSDAIGCLPGNGCVSTIQNSCPSTALVPSEATLGRHLARRLVQIGATDVFSVPGDFNLTLLDHLIAEPGLNLIGCCNELNAGYAADGFARCRGVGACVVTFTVGGLSVLNAIAGAYSENLPVICIVGGPNSNDYGTNRILHHTIGLPDFSQELRCFQTVTCYQVSSPIYAAIAISASLG